MTTQSPALANGDSLEYWKGAREGRLLFQKCGACGSVQFPPRHQCSACWETDLEWIESAGTGTVESFTIVRRAPIPAFRGKVPYVVAAILVDEGPRMITNVVGEDALEVAVDDRVEVIFPQDGDAAALPQFRRL
jgi:uncharacterized OB-fold protein